MKGNSGVISELIALSDHRHCLNAEIVSEDYQISSCVKEKPQIGKVIVRHEGVSA